MILQSLKFIIITVLFTISIALPMTVYAGTWVQTPNGWQVQSDDGNYLINQWYQSPVSGLYYYMGADGYMLHDTTTPDGYQVGSDGAWIQTPAPTQPAPEQQLAPGALSEEEIERRESEAGLAGNIDVEIVDEIHGDADAGQGYDWN